MSCAHQAGWVECPFPKAYSSFSLDFFIPLLIINILSYFMKSPMYLNGILWVYNANCIIHKFCCFKVSIFNIWFWHNLCNPLPLGVILSGEMLWQECHFPLLHLQFIPDQPSMVWLKTVEDWKALDCHFLNLWFKVFKYFKFWFF